MTVNTVVASGLEWVADFEAWLTVGDGIKKHHKNAYRHFAPVFKYNQNSMYYQNELVEHVE